MRSRLRLVVGLALVLAVPHATAAPDKPLDVTKHGIVYRPPGMAAVKVRRDIALAGAPKIDLYTPAVAKAGKLPVVVFINGVGDRPDSRLKDWQIYQDWARLVATRGYAAVLHETDGTRVQADIQKLLERLHADGASLGLDPERIMIWACSANVSQALPIVMDSAPAGVRAAVMYYGNGVARQLRKDLPVFWVTAGADDQNLIAGQRALWARAIADGLPWTMIYAPTLPHAFDALDTSAESRRIVGETLAFFDAQLGALPAPLPPSPSRDILANLYGQRFTEAAKLLEPMVAANPRDVSALSTLAWAYRGAGRSAEAVAAYRKLLEIDPGDLRAARQLVILAAPLGDCKPLAPLLAQLDGKVTDPPYLTAKATCDAIEGRREDARRSVEAAIATGANAGNIYYNLACALAIAHKSDDALAALETAAARGWSDVAHMVGDPDLASLRDSPRFAALVAKLRATKP
jgi:tetratricopeptide (TPR) repeat protein